MQNIQFIDFFDFGTSNTEAQGFFADFVEQPLATGLGELLRVVQAKDRPLRIENHGGSHHRTAQRPTADFVNPGHQVFDQGEVQSHLHLSGFQQGQHRVSCLVGGIAAQGTVNLVKTFGLLFATFYQWRQGLVQDFGGGGFLQQLRH
ncbi:hypothetical protein D9M71_717360 [compost metagenome]